MNRYSCVARPYNPHHSALHPGFTFILTAYMLYNPCSKGGQEGRRSAVHLTAARTFLPLYLVMRATFCSLFDDRSIQNDNKIINY